MTVFFIFVIKLKKLYDGEIDKNKQIILIKDCVSEYDLLKRDITEYEALDYTFR